MEKEKIKTNIYCITQFKDNSTYLHFLGCNWKCRGCIRFVGWDIHISPSDIKNLNKIYPNKLLLIQNFENVVRILKLNNAKKLYLGGNEPTTDPNIVKILNGLREEGFWAKLITNGSLLNTNIVDACSEITFSIKALNDEIHEFYTGFSNKETLKNFERFYDCGKIEVESIYIPGLIECEEILKIAKYIAGYNKNLKYRIDKYIYTNCWRDATEEEIKACVSKVKKILPNTYTFASSRRRNKSYAKCLYPIMRVKKRNY